MFTFHWREALEEAGDLHLLDITTREMLRYVLEENILKVLSK